MNEPFGSVLKGVLNMHRLPYAKAAEMADYDHSYVSRLIRGARMPTREFIERLVIGCGFSDEEWDRLLIAADFAPRHAAALLDPELREAVEFLADASIPQPYRESLRLQISALVGITRQMAA